MKKTEHYKEIILRGTYLSMAADVEWILLMIIARIFKKSELLKSTCINKELHNYTLFERISCIKTALKKLYPEFYSKHEKDLEQLDQLRGMRNKFGHGKIDWQERTTDYLWISEATDSGIKKTKYERAVIVKQLNEFRLSILSVLYTVQEFASKISPA